MADSNTSPPIAEISHEPSAFDQFMQKHQMKLIIFLVLLALAAVAAVAMSGLKSLKEQDQGSQLFNAEGENGFKEVINSRTSEAAQATAMLLLAKEQVQSDKKEAITTLENLLEKYPNCAVKFEAKLNLALILLFNEQKDAALRHLDSLAIDDEAGYTQVYANYILADMALQVNKNDVAKTAYQKAADYAQHTTVSSQFQSFSEVAIVETPTHITEAAKPSPLPLPSTKVIPEASSSSAVSSDVITPSAPVQITPPTIAPTE